MGALLGSRLLDQSRWRQLQELSRSKSRPTNVEWLRKLGNGLHSIRALLVFPVFPAYNNEHQRAGAREQTYWAVHGEGVAMTTTSLDLLVNKLRSTYRYSRFRQVLDKKSLNEAQAKRIVENMTSSRNRSDDLQKIFDLVDEPYTAVWGDTRPWFGRLIKPNARKMREERDERIAEWFKIVVDSGRSAEDKIDTLRKGPHHIYGVSVGFTTLMLYVLDRSEYSVWFEALHNGLRKLYHQTEKFNGRASQYTDFNNAVKNLAKQYGFDRVEMDWVLQEVRKFA